MARERRRTLAGDASIGVEIRKDRSTSVWWVGVLGPRDSHRRLIEGLHKRLRAWDVVRELGGHDDVASSCKQRCPLVGERRRERIRRGRHVGLVAVVIGELHCERVYDDGTAGFRRREAVRQQQAKGVVADDARALGNRALDRRSRVECCEDLEVDRTGDLGNK